MTPSVLDKAESSACPEGPHMALILGQSCLKLCVPLLCFVGSQWQSLGSALHASTHKCSLLFGVSCWAAAAEPSQKHLSWTSQLRPHSGTWPT